VAGICNITIDAREQGPASIFLLNICGELILHERVNLSGGCQTFSLSGIGTGIYLIRVDTGSSSYTSRIISMNPSSGMPNMSHSKSGWGSGKLKNNNSAIVFPYNTGDLLKITGKSGIYRTVMMMVPTQDQTVSFDFINCTDAANNHYAVVKVGDQIWMAENLRTTKYRNGDAIPGNITNAAWGNLRTGAFSWYNQDSVKYAQDFGGLYNWYSVNDPRSIAPEGWHVPTDAEWTALSTYLGGVNNAGGMLKESGYKHWRSPNSRATNETGFTALPGGYRFQNGTYDEIKTWCVWWCSTSSGSTLAPTRAVFYNSFELGRDLSDKRDGFTIRCIRD
jgi:uncharacterized protein (TIGR02145 family)